MCFLREFAVFLILKLFMLNFLSNVYRLGRIGRAAVGNRLHIALAGIFLVLAGPAFALPDWAVDIEDPGQDNLPAGSTIVYEVEIRNDAFAAADDAGPTTITFDVCSGHRIC
jgi:hypothetical protein